MSPDERVSGDRSLCNLYAFRPLFERKTPMLVPGREKLFSWRSFTVSHKSRMTFEPSVLHSTIETAQLEGRELRVFELFRVVPLLIDDII